MRARSAGIDHAGATNARKSEAAPATFSGAISAGSASVEVDAEGYETFRRDVELSAGAVVVVEDSISLLSQDIQQKVTPWMAGGGGIFTLAHSAWNHCIHSSQATTLCT